MPATVPPGAPTAPASTGTGLDDSSFLNLLNGLNTGFQQNNALVDQKNAVLDALLGNPIDDKRISSLPPDIQNIIKSGDRNQMSLQVQVLNDALNNKNASVASSIQYLTSGWQTAQQRYNTEIQNLNNAASLYNVAPKDLLKVMAPDVYNSLTPQQREEFGTIPAPLLKSNQIPNIGAYSSSSITIPGGTIASQTNNPLNIKFVAGNELGATDSGIAATDGGTFAGFDSPQSGLAAAAQLLQSSSYASLTIDEAMRRWSNGAYGAEVSNIPAGTKMSALSTDQLNQLVSDMAKKESGATVNVPTVSPIVQSYVDGIKSGTVTSISSVPLPYRNMVSLAMDQQKVSSPLGDRRYTLAANAIVANYIDLPGYSLTANGQPYLERIAAATKTPGSVSDQDLLDSLTKLNTSGNAISDAQVSLITNGKSFSDAVSVWKNKLGSGGVLSNDQRNQIQTIATNIYKNYAKSYQPIYDQVTKQLSDAGIPQQFWTIPDLNALAAASGIDLLTGGTGSEQPAASGGNDPLNLGI